MTRRGAKIRWLLLAGVFVCGLGARGALATAIHAGASRDADDHARYCKCRSCRPDSCCCGPRKPSAAPAARARVVTPPTPGSSPCLKAAPCGERGAPNAQPTGPVGKAVLALGGSPPPSAAGVALPPTARCSLPARRADRLDDPPDPRPGP